MRSTDGLPLRSRIYVGQSSKNVRRRINLTRVSWGEKRTVVGFQAFTIIYCTLGDDGSIVSTVCGHILTW